MTSEEMIFAVLVVLIILVAVWWWYKSGAVHKFANADNISTPLNLSCTGGKKIKIHDAKYGDKSCKFVDVTSVVSSLADGKTSWTVPPVNNIGVPDPCPNVVKTLSGSYGCE